MNRLEALADAVSQYTGYNDPLNVLYKLRNPGGLKGFSQRHLKVDSGHRVFTSHVDGYKALLYDLHTKCSGQSNSGLKPDSPLNELVRVFDMKDETTRYVVKFLRKALGMETIKEDTPICFFME